MNIERLINQIKKNRIKQNTKKLKERPIKLFKYPNENEYIFNDKKQNKDKIYKNNIFEKIKSRIRNQSFDKSSKNRINQFIYS